MHSHGGEEKPVVDSLKVVESTTQLVHENNKNSLLIPLHLRP